MATFTVRADLYSLGMATDTHSIYTLTNTLNGMVYVGATRDPKRRQIDHNHWKPGRRTRMARIVDEVGRENFEFQIIDTASDEAERDRKEVHWIAHLGTVHPNGYNMESGGKRGYRTHPESIERMRLKQMGNKYHNTPVRRSDGVVYESVTAAAADLGVLRSSVSRVLIGMRKTIKGFTFSYYEEG